LDENFAWKGSGEAAEKSKAGMPKMDYVSEGMASELQLKAVFNNLQRCGAAGLVAPGL